ncbi:MAG: type II toxin-antitoxin system ParD family antitoxin [Rhodoplanes sp.]|uniref:type II toxin-antitoxin system ParD family antitoxin n=1 Tax=Rhodoplanes sp. TaxID=1968906 RepID=UPI0018581155|nr:type II toxin-antitoxin system ParD family antitoxin [Rhodoplanes sp.]NVO13388.1 type II toxin-antitoxin system ParD family antitoxin [Rhodoplanes sp.]
MPARSLTVTLPADLAEMVESKVASGAYASESEVVGDALRALDRETAAHDAALRRQVETSLADPRPPVPAEGVFGRLRAHHVQQRA